MPIFTHAICSRCETREDNTDAIGNPPAGWSHVVKFSEHGQGVQETQRADLCKACTDNALEGVEFPAPAQLAPVADIGGNG